MFRFDWKTGQTDIFPLPHKAGDFGVSSVHIFIRPDGQVLAYSSRYNEVWKWNNNAGQFDISWAPGENAGLLFIGSDQKGALIFRKNTDYSGDLCLMNPDDSWQELRGFPKLNYTTCTGQDFSRQIYFCTLEGVLRVNFEQTLFQNFIPLQKSVQGYSNRAFRGITADLQGNVWMVGEMMGLFCAGPRNGGVLEKIPVKNRFSGLELLTNNALSLQTDNKGRIWSARDNSGSCNLLRIDPVTGFADTFLIKDHRISAFTLLQNGSLLIAAVDDKAAALFLFHPETKQIAGKFSVGKDKNSKSSPLFLLENPSGKVWVGSKEGLQLFDPNQNDHWPDFPGNNEAAHEFPVSVMMADGDSVLWCGALGGGLRKLNLKTGAWEVFTMANGLPANKIAGILPDENRNLWISTYDGLSFFQPANRLFTNFFTNNGLTHNEFNRFSFFRHPDGRMFFGGLNGVNYFKPSELLASFSQGNDSLLIAQLSWFAPDGKTKTEQFFELQDIRGITLPADNRYCSIRLALANYLQPENNRFAWKLEGYDADWHLNGTNNDITFHYLPAGKYRLRIKAANPTGVWNKTEHVLEIEVREFWYKTWWAFGLFSAAIFSLFYLYYRYQVTQQLEHAETLRIKELDTLKTRLYTNITHEFRTPLTVILGMADEIEALEKEEIKNAKHLVINAVGLIRRNGKNLLRLINQLLDLAKLDSGTMKTRLVQADVIAYLQYLTGVFLLHGAGKKSAAHVLPETPELRMDFDEEKVQAITYNLLSNALKFTKEGGKVVLHATQVVQNSAPFLQLKVQDTGVGIEEKELSHIFDRFYQADNSSTRKGEGTGIGLTLTKELVELMGGNIVVESAIGKGTVFTIVLPVRHDRNTPKQAVITPVSAAQLPAADTLITDNRYTKTLITDKPLLLIIEDNADVVTYIEGLLKKDYQIETASNGQTGIEKAFELVPDIIVSDVMMPEKDGYEVCDTLKKDERTSHIPLILLTAKATQEDKVAGLRVGADAYLQKPFDKAELFVRIEKLLELRQRLQQRYSGNASFDNFLKVVKTEQPPTIDDIFLQKIRAAIETNMGEPELGILHLCKAVHLSYTQVFRKMKALTGENPTFYIRKMRLLRARQLLQTSEMNVSQIAYEVGFSDPGYFSRVFHEEFGAAPSAMRK
ncbi:MAG: response regulator [Lewinellaceae bacterium]|nr:response regulator [Lewinellaceae bacterium]